ncbi:MAG: CvpA family protein [Verrucomicrobiota bacterium]
MDRGSLILLSFTAVILGYQAIKGWRLGLVRQIVRFGALAAAYATGLFAGGFAVPFLRPLGYPDFILSCIGGVGLGLLAYLFICLVGGILFKRTAHQDMGLVWFFYGVTGALMGIAFGLVLLLLCADAIRFLGGIVEAKPAPTAMVSKPRHATPGTTAQKPGIFPSAPVLALVAELKTSLEHNLPGEILQAIDPVPKKSYAIANKMGRILSDPNAVTRFLSFPGAMELATRPEIQALRDDPEILRIVQQGQILQLLKNEKIIRVANDPQIAALLKKFDLEKALDHALKSGNPKGA